MTIGIDASRAVNEEAGIGRYTKEIVRRLIDYGDKDYFRLLFTYVRDDGRKKRWIEDIKAHRENIEVTSIALPGQLKEWLWGQRWWGIGRYFPGAEVIFAPSFFEAAVGEKTPQVVTIHDLSHSLFPDQRGVEVSRRLTERNRKIAHLARRIIVPSQVTKDDLIRLFGVEEGKIVVIPLGYSPFFAVMPKPARQPFFLFVGTISPRKNLVGLLHAYAKLPDNIRAKYSLKIVGATGWKTGETFATYQRLQLSDRVEFVGHASDEELKRLYNQAAAFLFPSLYEGFGLPILEAMACGCPVVTSNISSMPEVAGQAAVLVDPRDPIALADAIERLVSSPPLWFRLQREGWKRVKEFSWEQTATKTLEVIHAAASREA